MSFDWREYFDLAQNLPPLSGPTFSEEAAFRCAVSRAYYAAFGHASTYAQANLNYTPTGSGRDHGRIRQHFRSNNMTHIAADLADLHIWRKICDYDASSAPNFAVMFGTAITTADSMIKNL